MRRRLNLLLTLIFLMLVLLCGAGAYFTDQQQASIRAAAASMGLTVSKPSYGTIPKLSHQTWMRWRLAYA